VMFSVECTAEMFYFCKEIVPENRLTEKLQRFSQL